MKTFENVHINDILRFSNLVGPDAQIEIDYLTVSGTVKVGEQEFPVDGDYRQVNADLRQLSLQFLGDSETTVDVTFTGVDSAENSVNVTSQVDLSQLPMTFEDRLDGDGNSFRALAAKTVACPLQLQDVFANVKIDESLLIAAIKAESGRRITDLYPIWRQQNAAFRMIELLDRGSSTWTDDEKNEVDSIRNENAALNFIRVRSDDLEKQTDLPFAVWSDDLWA